MGVKHIILLCFLTSCGPSDIDIFLSNCSNNFIIGGDYASSVKFVVTVTEDICSGTVVNSDFVLTAKHCIRNNQTVRIDSKVYTFTHVMVHPDADIALIKLDVPTTIQTVTLSHNAPHVGDEIAILGWGVIWTFGDSDGLRGGVTKINRFEDDTLVFSNSPNVCFGDSGGPVLNKNCELTGVHSRTSPQCWKEGYSIRVDLYYNWIIENMEILKNIE